MTPSEKSMKQAEAMWRVETQGDLSFAVYFNGEFIGDWNYEADAKEYVCGFAEAIAAALDAARAEAIQEAERHIREIATARYLAKHPELFHAVQDAADEVADLLNWHNGRRVKAKGTP